MLENLAVVLIAPALPCPVRNQVSVEKPDWSTVPFIMADQGPVRRRIELWFRRQKISNPSIYARSAAMRRWYRWWRSAAA